MSDGAAEDARRMRTERASDEAAAQNIERRQGITQRAGVQIDRKRVEYTPETRVGDLTISRGRQVTEREEMGAGARDRGAGAALRQQRFESQLRRQKRQGPGQGKEGGVSAKQVMSLAKKSPVGLAATAAVGALQGNFTNPAMGRTVGRGCVRSLWTSLWPTFGHTIYLIGIIFFIAWSSRFARKWLPQIGEEWFPPELISKIPKGVLVPLKLAELIGILFVLFWVLLLDLACLGLWAFMLAVLLSATNFV